MPRGRHRHSPPLHRLLPPSVIAGVSLALAGGSWLFADPVLLRGIAGAVAVPALVAAVMMRRWDRVAGRRVAELERARKSDEWRHEERAAELESDLEESREVRSVVEKKLRAKRSELAALRNEHAALLRRYAAAETGRANALEGRRRLAIEASAPARALTTGRGVVAPPAGSTLFREAGAALELLAAGSRTTPGDALGEALTTSPADGAQAGTETGTEAGAQGIDGDDVTQLPGAGNEEPAGRADQAEETGQRQSADGRDAPRPVPAQSFPRPPARGGRDRNPGTPFSAFGNSPKDNRTDLGTNAAPAPVERNAPRPTPGAAEGGEAPEKRGAAGEGPRPAAEYPRHFTVPAAAAVAPTAPGRRRELTGGFDFFGVVGQAAPTRAALEDAQNSDLADVVGDEALADHKAESERRRPVHPQQAVGQVIDLTEHDETEALDVSALRNAVS